ncbi:MAG: substrate-binding domain-containing protein [Campylobacteraceae bacterium]|jgi:ABC-type molybdate transport system substrate-binding protein|nr:substrate-binding domain-containing protein [Campylobacteraceae bacterium]
MTFKENSSRIIKYDFGRKILLGAFALFFSYSVANAAAECSNVRNPDVVIAVASNMWEPAQSLAGNYTTYFSPNTVIQVCHDATGNLLKEINGAVSCSTPSTESNYSLFLAANATAPYEVCEDYKNSSVSNYTTGIPALWTKNGSLINNVTGIIDLDNLDISGGKVAIANQTKAPYGLAAQKIMENATKQWDEISGGGYLNILDNIDLTYLYVNATESSVGYIAYSRVCQNGSITDGYGKPYPDYGIAQAGIMIDQNNATKESIAQGFWDYILNNSTSSTDDAQYILQTGYCYGAPPSQ